MRKSSKHLTLIAVTLLSISFITSCDKKAEVTAETIVEPTFNLAAAKAEIEAANDSFEAFFAKADSVGLGSLYTEDTKLMLTGMPAVIGRNNVKNTLAGVMQSGVSSVGLKTIDVWGTENLITEEGEYSMYVGENEVDQGKYIVLWKKTDGKWQLFRDIFNSNKAAE